MQTAAGTSPSNLSDSDLADLLNSGGAAASPAGAPSSAPNTFTSAINGNESSGASDATAGIVNPASGARGNMQVMPRTAADPGFGVSPSNGTPEDDARMGRQYYNALNSHFKDPTIAAMAYDWGPGNVDKWLKSGADPSKVPNETLAYALNFNQQTGAGQSASAAKPQDTQSTVPDFDAIAKQYPGASVGAGDETNPLVALGAGLGRGVQKTALGTQSLVGKGLSAIGATGAGNWLQQDAATGNVQGQKDVTANGGNTLAGETGQFIGQVAPALVAPMSVGGQAVAGGILSAGDASLNGGNVAQSAVEGAGLGAGGAALGHILGAAAEAAKVPITDFINRLKGGEPAATKIIQNMLGDQADTVIQNLRQNSDEIIPGSLPTAAETANNTTISAAQRALRNTPEGQAEFSARDAQNNAARFQAGQDAVGPSASNSNPAMMGPGLEAEQQAFTQAQAQRIAQGQSEVAPVTQAQADAMQTPEYQTAINAARREAANSGVGSFDQQSATINQGLADQVSQLAGTPDSLEQLRGARRTQGTDDYAGVAGQVGADTPAFADLEARPGFNLALRRAAGIEDNLQGSAAREPFTTEGGTRSLAMNPDGTLNWVEQPGNRMVDAGILQGARSELSDMANEAARAGRAKAAAGYRATLDAVDGFLGNPEHVGNDIANSFNTARANYAANSVPIDQQTFLQSKLAGAVNNLTGEANPTALNSTINAVRRDQLKPGLRPADRITPDQVNQLQQIGQQAQRAPGNMLGLDAQGQELIRQQLTQRAMGGDQSAVRALGDFNSYLSGQSPGYAAAINGQATTGLSLASRQNLANVLDKLSQSANNASGEPQIAYSTAKAALRNANLQGPQAQYGDSLLKDLQRSTTANASLGAAGSQTAANEALKQSGLLKVLGHGIDGGTVGAIAGEGSLHGLGAIPGALAGKVIQSALKEANGRTVKAAIDLFTNPKKMADVLEKYKSNPKAGKAFLDALKAKALKGGRAGVIAVQSYQALTSQ